MANGLEDKVAPKMPPVAVAELGCLLVFMALWWPFVAFCVAAYSILIAELESPFINTVAFFNAPTMISIVAMTTGLVTPPSMLSPEELKDWSQIPRVVLKVLWRIAPFFVAMMILNSLTVYWLEAIWDWQSPFGHQLIMLWAVVVSGISTVCTYFLWKLMRYPFFRSMRPDHPTT